MSKKINDDTKKEIIDALKRANGIKREAARLLGIPESTFRRRYIEATKDKSVQNLDPFIPDGQKLRGVSTLYDKNGEQIIQWVKTNQDIERQIEVLRAASSVMMEAIPKAPINTSTPVVLDKILSQYTITDYHMGMMAWAAETGEDWNTEIAEEFLFAWFMEAIKGAPASHTAVLAQLGDFLHYDSLMQVTPTSKHVLDTDAKYALIVQVTIRVLRRIIDALLDKHQHVHIIMAEGNHDLASSVWLRAMFTVLYEHEKRVTVEQGESGYYAYEWGKTSLFYHHGHKKKMKDLATVFAGMFREMFGRTTYAYAHTGHLHHIDMKENNLMVTEQHPSLSAPDAYSAKLGLISKRAASVINYHRDHGEVSRFTVRPEMVQR
jgi:hypothetical protein